VFLNSGFKRSLCGGKWEFLSGKDPTYNTPRNAFLNLGTSTAHIGCCLHGTFMAHPNLSPFNQTTSCEKCPVGKYSRMSDELNCPYTATTCPGTNGYAVEPASCRVPIPDCTYAVYANPGCTTESCWSARTCGIRQAVNSYILFGDDGSYGPIEDWNTSLVTDMSYVFYSSSSSSPLRSFNANISAWDVGKVTSMSDSTYTLFLPSPRSGLFLAVSTYFPFFFLWRH